MAFTLTMEDESLPTRALVITIYAPPGVGKTTLAFTAEKPLLFDFDEGVQRSVGRKATVGFNSWADVEQFVSEGHLDKIDPKTIICDTAETMITDYMGHHVMKADAQNKQKSGSLSLKGYGAIKDLFSNFVMRELRSRNIDLIIIAHDVENEDQGVKTHRPKVTGGSKDILMAKSDLLGYIYIENGKRILNFNPSDSYLGKNCAGFDPIEIKDQFSDPEAKTQMADIIQQTKMHMSRQTEEQEKALELISEFRNKIFSYSTIEELESISAEIELLSPSYRVQAQKMYADKYTDLWIDLFVNKAKTVIEFNDLIEKANAIPKRFQMPVKTRFIEIAQSKGFDFNKETKVFRERPGQSKDNGEVSSKPVAEKSKTTKSEK